MYPDADVPVLPLAFVPTQRPAQLFALGAVARAAGRRGRAGLASGSITHNLRRVFGSGLRAPVDRPEIAESAAFRHWMLERSAARDWEALFDYRARAPHAALTCTRPTSTCCPGTSPPVRAGADMRRCACTTA